MNYFKLAAGLGVVAIIYAVYWGIDHSGYTRGRDEIQAAWDKEREKIAQEALEAAQNNLKNITKLEEAKNANLKTIAGLRSDLAGLRLRLPPSTCGGADTAGNSPTTGTRALPVDPQIALDDFKRGVESDAADADTMIESCRVVMDWARQMENGQ
ncbi:MAG: hypothetical protein WAW87_03980 [Candidatus Ferrigenium altingense]